MDLTFTIIFFFLGLIFGSFLNSVIWRLHSKESFLSCHSICTSCRHILAWKDLLPLFSFIFLGRRCRYCSQKISWQYPLVELFTAILFVVFYWQLALSWLLLFNLVFLLFLIIIFVYDLRYYLILDKVSVPAMIVALIASLLLGVSFWGLILAVIVGGGFFFLQFLISHGKWIGGGDIRLGVVMGLMLGWPKILVALVLAYFIGSIISVILVIVGKKKMASTVPFGTFLALSTVVTLLWGNIILDWYLALVW